MRRESALAWLDLDEEARQQMQEVLAVLNEPDTVDQLGISQVRDVLSSLFFPGTSTLWRRARYMLFVSWMYLDLEQHGTKGKTGEQASRKGQKDLIAALKYGEREDVIGLIGARKDEPQRLPDELIWHGLYRWGVRTRDGSRARYWRSLEADDSSAFSVGRGDFDEVFDTESGSWWHDLVPDPPKDYLDETTFDLERAEAEYLRGQLAENVPESVLARMTQGKPLAGEGSFLWENTKIVNRLSPEMQTTAGHARVFSYAMQGAGYLYSYLVAKKRGRSNKDGLADAFVEWSTNPHDPFAMDEIGRWPDRSRSFWALIKDHNNRLRLGTESFVDDWMAMATRSPRKLLDDPRAEELLRERERKVKSHQARLSEPKALDHARDESGTSQLDFRWSQGCQIANDIVTGLTRKPQEP